MFALALTVTVLSASTDASVVVARRIGFEAKKGTELAQELVSALKANPSVSARLGTLLDVTTANERLTSAGFPDTSVCNGAAACVASLAKVGGFTRLVALQLVKLGGDVAVDASVVDGATGKALASVTRTIKLKNAREELEKLASDLLVKVPPLDVPTEPPPPPQTPVSSVTPQPPQPPVETPAEPIVEVPPPPGLSTGRKVSLGLGGAAVVGLGVGIGLGVSASAQAEALSVRDPSYDAKVAATKGTALGADLSYGAAGALAVTALIVWLVSGN